ncbi:MAG: hypothetical protein KGZ25_11115 [Planctomycetes bacterium]|nr:hypothetical protein [Planctomycetota bacterium]
MIEKECVKAFMWISQKRSCNNFTSTFLRFTQKQVGNWVAILVFVLLLAAVGSISAGEKRAAEEYPKGYNTFENAGLRMKAVWTGGRMPGDKGRVSITLTNVSEEKLWIPINREMFRVKIGYGRKNVGKETEHGALRQFPGCHYWKFFKEGVRVVKLDPGEKLSYKDSNELSIACSPYIAGEAEIMVTYTVSEEAGKIIKKKTPHDIWADGIVLFFVIRFNPHSIPEGIIDAHIEREVSNIDSEARENLWGESAPISKKIKALARLVEKRQSYTIRLVIYALKEEELPPALREFAYYQLLAPAMEGICTGRILSVLYGAGADPETSESLRRAIVSTLRYVGARGEEYPLISQRGVHHFRYDVTTGTRKKIHEALQKIATVTEGKLRKEAKAALEAVGKYPLEEPPAEKSEEE